MNIIRSNNVVARGCAFHIPFQNNSIQMYLLHNCKSEQPWAALKLKFQM